MFLNDLEWSLGTIPQNYHKKHNIITSLPSLPPFSKPTTCDAPASFTISTWYPLPFAESARAGSQERNCCQVDSGCANLLDLCDDLGRHGVRCRDTASSRFFMAGFAPQLAVALLAHHMFPETLNFANKKMEVEVWNFEVEISYDKLRRPVFAAGCEQLAKLSTLTRFSCAPLWPVAHQLVPSHLLTHTQHHQQSWDQKDLIILDFIIFESY